jgi:hypothetical protein
MVPVFASPGFCGWFGYWLVPRSWDFVKVYVASWRGMVMIEDIYEQKYVVSADDPAALCEAIASRRVEPPKPKVQRKRAVKSRARSEETLF